MVQSDTGLVISAHRWNRGPAKEPMLNGLAYSFDINNMYKGNNELNIGNPNNFGHRLIPMYFEPTSRGDQLPFQYIQDYQKDQLLPDLAYGEAGFSLHLTKDTHGNNILIMGAPGIRVWRGGVVRYQDNTGDIFYTQRLNSNSASFDKYRIVKRNHGGGNEYFGYAVSSGKFYRSQPIYYVGGAPRANELRGEVLIFEFPEMNPTEWAVDGTSTRIIGTQFGSYFGSVLASGDFNRDGIDELLIGAPCFNEPITTTAESFIESGTVFLYSSTLVNSRHFTSQNLIRITPGAGSKQGGRFGSSMMNLGDINEDGYQDFAIGAPYEDETGAVYIFYGKEYLNTEWTATWRFTPSDIAIPTQFKLRGFGCSFSAPLDIDNNYTPDLSIGAFMSQSVVIMRTRPILDFQVNTTYFATDKNSDFPIRQLSAGVKSFLVQTCIKLRGKALTATQTRLKLSVSLSIDTEQTVPRFSFIGEEGIIFIDKKAIFDMEVNPIGPKCKQLKAQTNTKVLNENSPSIDHIYFEQLVNYEGKSIKENGPLIYKIQSDSGVVNKIFGEDTFEPMAPFPLRKRIVPDILFISPDCQDVNRCVPKLGISAWFADDSNPNESKKIKTVTLDWTKRHLTIHVKLFNTGEPAYSPYVRFNFYSLKTPRIDFTSPELLLSGCQSDRDKEFTCTLSKPLRADEPKELIIPFDLYGIYATVKSEQLILGVSVGVRDDPESLKVLEEDLVLTLVADVRIKFIGSVTPPNEAVSVHSQFSQQYEVILNGRSPVETLVFNFKFPVGDSEQSVLHVEKPTGNGIECRSNDPFADFSKSNPDHPTNPADGTGTGPIDKEIGASRRRRRRAQSDYNQRLPDVSRIIENENITLLNCVGRRCFEVACVISKVGPDSQLELINFNMKADASKAVELLAKKRLLLLESDGKVEILKGVGNGPEHTASTFSQTVIQFNAVSIAAEISIWWYIGSGIFAFIVLLLLMFLLYKYGFFRRATKEQLLERKAEVEVQEAQRRASMLENPNHEQEHGF